MGVGVINTLGNPLGTLIAYEAGDYTRNGMAAPVFLRGVITQGGCKLLTASHALDT